MNNILLLMLIFAIAVFLIMVASIWFMNFFSKKYIGEKHMVLEELTKGEIPTLWSGKFKEKCLRLKANGKQEQISKIKQEAHATYIKKLNTIVNYIQKTKLVEN
jgi:hypothetical protein